MGLRQNKKPPPLTEVVRARFRVDHSQCIKRKATAG
jgi:hypothetical protein